MKQILASSVAPTALFAGNDTLAIGAMTAIREAGLSIPEDFAVVGYDDIPGAAFAYPLSPLELTIRESCGSGLKKRQGGQPASGHPSVAKGPMISDLSPSVGETDRIGDRDSHWGQVRGGKCASATRHRTPYGRRWDP
jgi:Periplasmic binding protein-like domain